MTSPGMPEGTVAGTSNISELQRNCPNRLLLDALADKWTICILAELESDPQRFNELRRRLDGISQRVLTQALRQLERNGFISRSVATSGPVAVTYEISGMGKSVRQPLQALYDWTNANGTSVTRAQNLFDMSQPAHLGRSEPIS